MSYCIYLRKSRADLEAEARNEGETLARHEKALMELSHRLKLAITQIYREIESGETISARPVMQQLLSEVEHGIWEGVLVMEVERLARGDTIDQGIVAKAFKYSETKIITPAKTYDPSNEFDEEYFEFGLFMSRREYKTINRRLQAGRIASAKEGKYQGSRPPYGYKIVKIVGEKGNTLEIVPERAAIVRQIYDWYLNGIDGKRAGRQRIAKELNALNIPPNTHDYWMTAVIKKILTNPVYIGKIRWRHRAVKKQVKNGKLTHTRPLNDDYILSEGKHPAIIDDDTFYAAQKIAEEIPPAPVGYKNELKNPFAGLIRCSECGRSMVFRRGVPERRKPDYLVCHARACKTVSAPFHLVETAILSELQKKLDKHTVDLSQIEIKQNDDEIKILQNAQLKIKTELASIETQKNSLHDFLERGVYDVDTFINRSKLLADKSDKLKEELISVENKITKKLIPNPVNIPLTTKILEEYDLMTADNKNKILKELIHKIIYKKDKNGMYRGSSASDFELSLFLRIKE